MSVETATALMVVAVGVAMLCRPYVAARVGRHLRRQMREEARERSKRIGDEKAT